LITRNGFDCAEEYSALLSVNVSELWFRSALSFSLIYTFFMYKQEMKNLFLLLPLLLAHTVPTQAANLKLPNQAVGRWVADCDDDSPRGKSFQPFVILKTNGEAILGNVFFAKAGCQGKSWDLLEPMSLKVEQIDKKGTLIDLTVKKVGADGYLASQVYLEFSDDGKTLGIGFSAVKFREEGSDDQHWSAVQYESFPYTKK
jgi:hypothetical protein